MATLDQDDLDAIVAAVRADIERTGGMLDGVRSVLAGITRLSSWLRIIMRSDSGDAIAMSEINTGGGSYDPTIASQEAIADASDPDAIASALAGPGAIEHKITINKSGNPVDGAEVWVTTDAAGENVVAGTLYTNASGEVVFMLDAGDYYAWVQKAGINFTNPTPFEVE